MKNHELLDLIGDVNEDYVRAAGGNVVRPRFRWKGWAAAACAALVLCAYPVWRLARPTIESVPLHEYTVVEGSGGNLTTQHGEIKTPPAGALPGSTEAPDGTGGKSTYVEGGEDAGGGEIDGAHYNLPGQDIPVDQEPYDQYNSLYENARLDEYPEWYGGAYIDHNDSGEPSRLVVCIVEGFRTPDLEQQIAEWVGEGVWAYRDVKYSRGYLQELMERLNDREFLDLIDGDGIASSWGVYEEDNCIRMEWRGIPGDTALAELAKLDPDGDAIQVLVSTQSYTVTGEWVKGLAPASSAAPVPGGERAAPAIEPSAAETAQPARYDVQPAKISELPENKYDDYDALKKADGQAQAKYDVIAEGE